MTPLCPVDTVEVEADKSDRSSAIIRAEDMEADIASTRPDSSSAGDCRAEVGKINASCERWWSDDIGVAWMGLLESCIVWSRMSSLVCVNAVLRDLDKRDILEM